MSFIELHPIPWGQEPPAHLRQIYEEAFPPEERRPWAQLFGRERCEHIAQLIAFEDRVVGFLVSWELPSSHYFEYLVIDPELRGQGLGSKVLQRLGQLYDDEYPIVLECEPAGYSPMAERRLAFYQRFGLEVQPYPYRQPPYGQGLPWVDLHLLANRALSREDFSRIQQEIHQIVYRIQPVS